VVQEEGCIFTASSKRTVVVGSKPLIVVYLQRHSGPIKNIHDYIKHRFSQCDASNSNKKTVKTEEM